MQNYVCCIPEWSTSDISHAFLISLFILDTAAQPTFFACIAVNATRKCYSIYIGLPCSVFLLFCDIQLHKAMKPKLQSSLLFVANGLTATLMWNHTDHGPCFNNLTFSYNITWYSVVGGVPISREGQSGVTGPGATEYTITNLMNDTDYTKWSCLGSLQVTQLHVYSDVATVNFTAEGVYVYVCNCPYIVYMYVR